MDNKQAAEAMQLRDGELIYERKGSMDELLAVTRPLLRPDEKLIWRTPFRWKTDNGIVCNGYEMFPAEEIAELLGSEVVWTLNHIAAIRALKTEEVLK